MWLKKYGGVLAGFGIACCLAGTLRGSFIAAGFLLVNIVCLVSWVNLNKDEGK